MVGHVTPEAFDGGPIALVEEGDTVTINLQNRKLDVVRLSDTSNKLHNILVQQLPTPLHLQVVGESILATRQAKWSPPHLPVTGLLKKYRTSVTSAHYGATTY